jgi:hypothetical protein
MESGFPFNPRDVAAALGGEVTGRNKVLAPGPGHSPKDRSMSILIDVSAPGGFIVSSFAGDDEMQCKDHVRERMGLPGWQPSQEARSDDWWLQRIAAKSAPKAGPPPAPGNTNVDPDRERLFQIGMRMWEASTPIRGTLAETYLVSRGLWLPQEVEAGGQLRFQPRCAFKLQNGSTVSLPAMVALMTDPISGEPRAVHRTALAPDGTAKSDHEGLGNPKKVLGHARGAVVRLCPEARAGGSLGLAEGIENAIAAICGGVAPVWAAGMANNVRLFPVLEGVEALRIFADRGDAGEKAATEAGQRWAEAGRTAEATYPANGDWNDTMKGAA